MVDLTDPERARRWKYTYLGPNASDAGEHGEILGEWKKEELWPQSSYLNCKEQYYGEFEH